MSVELPADAIRATSPAEFRGLLKVILEQSELTAGQVSLKTGIPRSQCYALCSPTRDTLPTRPGQIKAFVKACGVGPLQTGLIMTLWQDLNDRALDEKVNQAYAARADDMGTEVHQVSNALSPAVINSPAKIGTSEYDPLRAPKVYVQRYSLTGTGVDSDTPAPKRRSRNPWIELLYLVLDDDRRTDRARRLLQLLLPIVAMIMLMFGTVIVFAIVDPKQGMASMAGVAVAVMVTGGVWAMRRVQHTIGMSIRRRKDSDSH